MKSTFLANHWLAKYERAYFRDDLVAGLTTAMLLIPQAMAYAVLAGMSPEIGLYASVVPLLVYAVLGSSKHLAVGPVAMVSLLVSVGIAPLAGGDPALYLALAVVLSVMVGLIQLLMGIFRFGFLTQFLSHPVVSGFTSAAAFIIAFSQIKHLAGFSIPRGTSLWGTIHYLFSHLELLHPSTVTIGVLSVIALVLLKKTAPRLPRALLVIVISTAAVWLLGLNKQGVKVVGSIPAGLPSFGFPDWGVLAGSGGGLHWTRLQQLGKLALVISLIGFVESLSVAKSFARKHGYELSPDRELIGLGVANLGSSLSGAYPVTGGFSRTAVNEGAGARSQMASVITAVVVACALLLFTPLLYFVPLSALAAVIVVAVAGLVDTHEMKHLWKVKRSDLLPLGATFFVTLTLGMEAGLLAGVFLSLALFLKSTTTPHTAVLGRLPGTVTYRNTKNYPQAECFDSLLLVRVDAPFYFGNVAFLKATLDGLLQEKESVKAVVLDASGVHQLDSSAEAGLREIVNSFLLTGKVLFFAGVKEPVMKVFRDSGFDEWLGREHFFFEMNDAVEYSLSTFGEAQTDSAADSTVELKTTSSHERRIFHDQQRTKNLSQAQ